jgi:hypothetical protein
MKNMKTLISQPIKAIIITFIAVFLLMMNLTAQTTFIIEEAFEKLNIEGPVMVYITKADYGSIEIEKSTQDFPSEELFQYSVKNGALNIKATGKDPNMHLLVKYKELNELQTSGVANLKTRDVLTAEFLIIKSDGATEVDMDIQTNRLELHASGAATMRLRGNTDHVIAKGSGASDIKAFQLTAKSGEIEASGASDIKINITEKADIIAGGASNVKLTDKPADVTETTKGVGSIKYGMTESDPSDVSTGYTGSQTGKKKFNGNWGGVELGFNTYVNSQFQTGLPTAYDFLELIPGKSMTIQLNLFEYNIPLIHKSLGLVTGLGLWVNNYRFDNNIILMTDSVMIYGYADTTRSYVKSKLTASYLALPLIIEHQFRNKKGNEIFHIGIGGYGAVKLGSKTKTVHIHENTKVKTKDHKNYRLNPFKYGITARVGYRKLNFFANYNLSTLFKDNKGPELYPFEAGITLVGW